MFHGGNLPQLGDYMSLVGLNCFHVPERQSPLKSIPFIGKRDLPVRTDKYRSPVNERVPPSHLTNLTVFDHLLFELMQEVDVAKRCVWRRRRAPSSRGRNVLSPLLQRLSGGSGSLQRWLVEDRWTGRDWGRSAAAEQKGKLSMEGSMQFSLLVITTITMSIVK